MRTRSETIGCGGSVICSNLSVADREEVEALLTIYACSLCGGSHNSAGPDCRNMTLATPGPVYVATAEDVAKLRARIVTLEAALDWYAERATSIGTKLEAFKDGRSADANYVMAVLTELALDGGRRAREAR